MTILLTSMLGWGGIGWLIFVFIASLSIALIPACPLRAKYAALSALAGVFFILIIVWISS
jgi:hypothetical protein